MTGFAFFAPALKGDRACDLERHFGRIDVVVRAVKQLHFYILNRIARENTVLHRFLNADGYRFDELPRHRAADDRIFKFVSLAFFVRLELDPDMAKLSFAAGLADEFSFGLNFLADRFFVRNLRTPDVRFDLEFTLHAVDDNFEMKFAHSADDRLAGFFIGRDAECRIFFRKLLHRLAHLLLVGLRLRLDRLVDDGFRKYHLLENDRIVFLAERVARARVLESDGGKNVAGKSFIDIFAMVGVHAENAAEAFLLVAARIIEIRPGLDAPRVNAKICKPSDKRIGHDLERKRGKFFARLTLCGRSCLSGSDDARKFLPC